MSKKQRNVEINISAQGVGEVREALTDLGVQLADLALLNPPEESFFEQVQRERIDRMHRRIESLESSRDYLWFTLIIAVGIALLALIGAITATTAHAAARVPLAWTVPDTSDSAGLTRHLEARLKRADGTADSLRLWADSLSSASPPVAPPGALQHAWTLVSEDWRAGGSMIQVRGCNGVGCAPWSNVYVVAVGVPDTDWVLRRAEVERGQPLPPVGGLWARRAQGRVAWALQPSDTTVAATIVHFEEIQRAHRDRLCQLFGYWCLRGTRQSCVEPPAAAKPSTTRPIRRRGAR